MPIFDNEYFLLQKIIHLVRQLLKDLRTLVAIIPNLVDQLTTSQTVAHQ